MTHRKGIFAASKEQGLTDFKNWSATLPKLARVQICHAEETLPEVPRKLLCPPLPKECTFDDHTRKTDALKMLRDLKKSSLARRPEGDITMQQCRQGKWREMRLRDHWYPNLQRLESRFVKRSTSVKSESSKAHMSNTSSIAMVKNN